jgi:HEAT repeat protein
MAVFFVVTQASHAFAANTADALFFRRFGVEELPLMILLSGPAVMVATLAYSAGLARVAAQRWLPVTTASAAVWVILEWVVIFADLRVIYPVIWISAQVLILLTLTVMWNAAASACNTRQAKRLFPLFASAGVAGGVIGNLLVGPLANLLGTQNLLPVQALLLVGSTVVLFRLVGFFDSPSGADEAQPGGMRRAFSAVRTSPLLKLAAVVIGLLFTVFYLVVFPFSEVVANSLGTEAEIAGFLGLFSSIATAATFFFSLFVTNRLMGRFGLVVTLMIVPVVYATGFSFWLVSFGLVTATLVRGAQWVAVNAIQGTAYSALFNVLTNRQRGPVMALMTAVPAQVGTMAAGLTLLAADALPRSAQFAIGLALSTAALISVVVMRPAYIDAVVSAVRRGLVGMFDAPHRGLVSPADRETERILESHLHDESPQARAFALAGLARIGGAPAAIEPFLEDEDALVRSAAFDSICEIEPQVVDRHLMLALADDSPEVRLNTLRYMDSEERRGGDEIDLEPILGDPDPRVRSAAARMIGGAAGEVTLEQMLSSDDPVVVAVALQEMAKDRSNRVKVDPDRYLHHEDPSVRAAAVAAHASLGAELADLLPALDDSSVRVRTASADALSSSQEGRRMLISVLQEGSVLASEAAIRAISPIREADAPEFTLWARDEARRAAKLDAYRRAMDGRADSRDEEFLIAVLARRADRLVQWVLMAMTTDETEEIMPIVARGVRSDDVETNSQAIEALETVGARSVLEVLLPLLEPEDDPATGIERRQALNELSTDFDPWLSGLAQRSLAQGAVPGLGAMADQPRDKLDEMGRVLVLQRVPMFSELDPEDLLLVARSTGEVHFDEDEMIFREGEPGTDLLVIVSGTVVVSRLRDGERGIIQSYSEGEHVGELSLLYEGDRSADVQAGRGGVHGLVVTKADLMSILEERPSVGRGMLRTLARRLVDQT